MLTDCKQYPPTPVFLPEHGLEELFFVELPVEVDILAQRLVDARFVLVILVLEPDPRSSKHGRSECRLKQQTLSSNLACPLFEVMIPLLLLNEARRDARLFAGNPSLS